MRNAEEVAAIALLLDPLRWRLYEHIRTRGRAVGRDEAAQAVAVSRNLAAFHLDRMAAAGLLTVEYRRLSGRRGRGAGRPAKLYRTAGRPLSYSLPATRYSLAAGILASALEEKGAEEDAEAAARRVAARAAAELGRELRSRIGHSADGALAKAAVEELGYEPVAEPAADPDRIDLRNCPFDELAGSHQTLICAMNHALLAGLLAALGTEGLVAEGPRPGQDGCCVRIAAAPT
jgi:predicted ArsR family transcriptional regulator